MTFDQYAIFGLLVTILVLFIWGRLRYDIVAMIALLSAVVMGLVPSTDVFAGFGHPATVTVAIVLILGHGLTKSGAVEGISHLISPLSVMPSLHIAALIFIAAFLSMFMNNVGALALLMPIAIQSTQNSGRSPATVLMPLSFGSILGGLVTMIGTPPNIIIATYRQEVVGSPFTMFDFSPVGGAVCVAGILFMALVGWRFVRVRQEGTGMSLFEIESYLFEMKITEESTVTGMTIGELEEVLSESNLVLTSLIHMREVYPLPSKYHKLVENDLLLLEGAKSDADKFISKHNLQLLGADSTREALEESADNTVAEVVLVPGSRVERRTVEQVRFKSNYGVNLLAVSREGRPHRGRLKAMRLRAGDVLLLHGGAREVENAITRLGGFPLAAKKMDFGKRKHGFKALAIFGLAIIASTTGLLDIQVALAMAVVAMLLARIINPRDLYDEVDWPVVVLLGAMIPVGSALDTTGATSLLATQLLALAGDVSPLVILGIILVLTMTLSDILNNAATAILMAPIGKEVAQALEANPDSFLMAVAIGASCAFLTPIGHQNNALIMGPGGYKFGDYWRVGLPLEIIIVLVSVPIIAAVWPLY